MKEPADCHEGEQIPLEDARALVRLLGEVAACPGTITDRKRSLMDGLSALIGADAWMWAVSVTNPDTGYFDPVSIATAGLDLDKMFDSIRGHYERDEAHMMPEDPLMAALLRPGHVVSRRRQQLLTDEKWYSHPHVQTDRKAAGVDHCLYSLFLAEDGQLLSAMGFHRRWGRPPFLPRDCRMVHIISTEVRWLHEAGVPEAETTENIPVLSPRQRNVLFLVLQGLGRREIARRLYLSPHTVHGYLKEIYALFGVGSQAELMSRFLQGNGADVGPLPPGSSDS